MNVLITIHASNARQHFPTSTNTTTTSNTTVTLYNWSVINAVNTSPVNSLWAIITIVLKNNKFIKWKLTLIKMLRDKQRYRRLNKITKINNNKYKHNSRITMIICRKISKNNLNFNCWKFRVRKSWIQK